MSAIETDKRGLLVACPRCAQRNRLKYEALKQTFRCGKCQSEIPPPAEPITPVERPRWEPPTLDLYEVACEVSAYAGRKRFGEEGED